MREDINGSEQKTETLKQIFTHCMNCNENKQKNKINKKTSTSEKNKVMTKKLVVSERGKF